MEDKTNNFKSVTRPIDGSSSGLLPGNALLVSQKYHVDYPA